ncbi:MAG: peptidylprolyl isomerase [Sulfurospirillum sp.]|jgi:peptidylprolyl isomerase|nr:peptidylprolyl isomerase [Sulfurospirillum sp.]MBP9492222.1 peptidylprolyl isomerase [Sulfurospirillum sp.]MBP9613244.1 peptidylprolyl isomerase [Sulfurospirillum sp.]
MIKRWIVALLLSASMLLASNHVVFETTEGKIVFALKPEIAPKACENFVGLVQKGYYDGVSFHRVIRGFMIQGGDPSGTGRGGQSIFGKSFEDEFKPNIVFDKAGLLAMANAGPNTNGSQFFITTVPTPHLNGRHTIFGEVVEGMNVVRKIENSEVDMRSKPQKQQLILKAYLK